MSQPVAKTPAHGIADALRGCALSALVAAVVLSPTMASARNTDRNQPMDIKAGKQEGSLDGNSINVLSGGVSINQGSLDIQASRADIHQRGGEVVRAVLTGSQAVLKQQMDDGTWMTAKADRIDYDMGTDVIVLTGNYTVSNARGSSSGQKMTYDLKTGRVESGGDSGPVTMRILPKTTPPAKPTPQGQGKP